MEVGLMLTLEEQLAQAKSQRRHAQRRAAAANDENARLRSEIRRLRHANFMLQRYADSPGSQAGYKRRYEELLASVHMAKDILVTELNGLPLQEPTTIEDWKPPKWARKV
jgi:chromosome segregation ATPase